MDDYIRKPVNAEVLQAIVQQWGRPAPGSVRVPEAGPQLSAPAADSVSLPLEAGTVADAEPLVAQLTDEFARVQPALQRADTALFATSIE